MLLYSGMITIQALMKLPGLPGKKHLMKPVRVILYISGEVFTIQNLPVKLIPELTEVLMGQVVLRKIPYAFLVTPGNGLFLTVISIALTPWIIRMVIFIMLQ